MSVDVEPPSAEAPYVLALTVEEYNAIDANGEYFPLLAQYGKLEGVYEIHDTGSAITDAIRSEADYSILNDALLIAVDSGSVTLDLGEFQSLGDRFEDKGDLVLEDFSSAFDTDSGIDVTGVGTVRLVATENGDDLRDEFKTLALMKWI